jgi:thiosulfate dehydrogenase
MRRVQKVYDLHQVHPALSFCFCSVTLDAFVQTMKSPGYRMILLFIGLIVLVAVFYQTFNNDKKERQRTEKINTSALPPTAWQPPDSSSIPSSEEGNLIRYGKQLIENTAYYLGPKGTVAAISNGMNCQNCHLNAGLKPFANCFSAVASLYPVYRPRSGIVESIEFRINDCLKRSLNGHAIDSVSKEMRAMVAYLKWVGKDATKGTRPKGANTEELAYLDRAADPIHGKELYVSKCQLCHGINGEGLMKADSGGFIYPPLWGANSYNTAAGLYRLSRFAGFIKNTMPFGATYEKPQLSDAEAWDLAAFVNSQPRPEKTFPHDWPVLPAKAIDYPYGPYADTFSERQHKHGPFEPIKKAKAALK